MSRLSQYRLPGHLVPPPAERQGAPPRSCPPRGRRLVRRHCFELQHPVGPKACLTELVSRYVRHEGPVRKLDSRTRTWWCASRPLATFHSPGTLSKGIVMAACSRCRQKWLWSALTTGIVTAAGLAAAAPPAGVPAGVEALRPAVELLDRMPLLFVPEPVSDDGATGFVVRGRQASVWLSPAGLAYRLHPAGGDGRPRQLGGGPRPGRRCAAGAGRFRPAPHPREPLHGAAGAVADRIAELRLGALLRAVAGCGPGDQRRRRRAEVELRGAARRRPGRDPPGVPRRERGPARARRLAGRGDAARRDPRAGAVRVPGGGRPAGGGGRRLRARARNRAGPAGLPLRARPLRPGAGAGGRPGHPRLLRLHRRLGRRSGLRRRGRRRRQRLRHRGHDLDPDRPSR